MDAELRPYSATLVRKEVRQAAVKLDQQCALTLPSCAQAGRMQRVAQLAEPLLAQTAPAPAVSPAQLPPGTASHSFPLVPWWKAAGHAPLLV